jgi:hypothetical protein
MSYMYLVQLPETYLVPDSVDVRLRSRRLHACRLDR